MRVEKMPGAIISFLIIAGLFSLASCNSPQTVELKDLPRLCKRGEEPKRISIECYLQLGGFLRDGPYRDNSIDFDLADKPGGEYIGAGIQESAIADNGANKLEATDSKNWRLHASNGNIVGPNDRVRLIGDYGWRQLDYLAGIPCKLYVIRVEKL